MRTDRGINTKRFLKDKPVVIFGMTPFSRLARYGLEHDGGRRVAAFTVNQDYVDTETWEGLPLVPFETLHSTYPVEQYDLLVTLGFRDMHGLRRTRCEEAMALGYTLTYYVSSQATLWHGAEIGANVLIYEQAVIQPFAQIGWNTTMRTGAILGHDSTVGNHGFLASRVVTGGEVAIGERCWIGIGAVVRDGVSIADRCFIGAGAVVLSDTEPDGVYVGNPARRLPDRSSLDVTSRPGGEPDRRDRVQ